MKYLGINCSHNGSICIVENGQIVTYIEEERLTGIKHMEGVEKSLDIILEKYDDFNAVICNSTISYKNELENMIKKIKQHEKTKKIPLYYVPHHYAHALSAFYTSPFDSEDMLCFVIDGAGEFFCVGNHVGGNRYKLPGDIEPWEMSFYKTGAVGGFETESMYMFKDGNIVPYYARFGTNNKSYRHSERMVKKFQSEDPLLIIENMQHMINLSMRSECLFTIEKKEDEYDYVNNEIKFKEVVCNDGPGLTMVYNCATDYLGYHQLCAGKTMGFSSYGKELPNMKLFRNGKSDKNFGMALYPGWAKCNSDVFKQERLKNGSKDITKEISHFYKDLAKTVQVQCTNEVIRLIKKYVEKTGIKNICLVGGYAQNTVTNATILKEIPDINLWVNPIANDGGISIGCAYAMYYRDGGEKIYPCKTLSLGFRYKITDELLDSLSLNIKYEKIGYDAVQKEAAKLLSENKIVGLHWGFSEGGPRALGNRSLLSDPRDINGRDKINRIKGREWFRPLAGTILEEEFKDWFDVRIDQSPWMSYVFKIKKPEKIPAMVHIDGTCRVQTINREQNEHYYKIIKLFNDLTGMPLVLNTSYNCAGKPISETPKQSIETFLKMSELECLFLEDYKITLI